MHSIDSFLNVRQFKRLITLASSFWFSLSTVSKLSISSCNTFSQKNATVSGNRFIGTYSKWPKNISPTLVNSIMVNLPLNDLIAFARFLLLACSDTAEFKCSACGRAKPINSTSSKCLLNNSWIAQSQPEIMLLNILSIKSLLSDCCFWLQKLFPPIPLGKDAS